MAGFRKSYFGVDGCPAGWFYVALSEEGAWSCDVVASLYTLLPMARQILIDMPIGLLEAGREERLCDRAARRVLGRARAASVFPVPVRPALQASSYEEAKAINRRLTGKAITIQAWNILPKLRELDVLMQQDSVARGLFHEAHPEVCFWALNGQRAMAHNKKSRPGRQEREAVLARYLRTLPDILSDAASRYRRAELGWDDMLDATALALTGWLGGSTLSSLPQQPCHDACGLPMEIVYHVPS